MHTHNDMILSTSTLSLPGITQSQRLHALSKESAHRSLRDKLKIMCACIETVQVLHQSKRLHRDIQTTSFMYDAENNCMHLLDAGFTAHTNLFGYYRSSILISPPMLSAPELSFLQMQGRDCCYSVKSDIYALGYTLARLFKLKLDELHLARRVHANDRIFQFTLNASCKGSGEEKGVLTTIANLLLGMTHTDPERRLSLSYVLESTKRLLINDTSDLVKAPLTHACKR